MRALKIGYLPISRNLAAPGDRRRLLYWAGERGHRITTDLTDNIDVLFVSSKADLNYQKYSKLKVPVVFDLVDSYLTRNRYIEDFLRGFSKIVFREVSGFPRPFSSMVANFCMYADAVICSSVEQRTLVDKYTSNSHIILDSHHEIGFKKIQKDRQFGKFSNGILWEGQPATIKALETINHELYSLRSDYKLDLRLVTDENYYMLLNRFIARRTKSLLSNFKIKTDEELKITPWSPDSLDIAASTSIFSILPLDLNNQLHLMKPENRLLIMWKLGLPCLVSPIHSYRRISNQIDYQLVCNSINDWKEIGTRLIEDTEFRITESLKGQAYVEDFHNSRILLSKWDNVIDSLKF